MCASCFNDLSKQVTTLIKNLFILVHHLQKAIHHIEGATNSHQVINLLLFFHCMRSIFIYDIFVNCTFYTVYTGHDTGSNRRFLYMLDLISSRSLHPTVLACTGKKKKHFTQTQDIHRHTIQATLRHTIDT